MFFVCFFSAVFVDENFDGFFVFIVSRISRVKIAWTYLKSLVNSLKSKKFPFKRHSIQLVRKQQFFSIDFGLAKMVHHFFVLSCIHSNTFSHFPFTIYTKNHTTQRTLSFWLLYHTLFFRYSLYHAKNINELLTLQSHC